jgi:TRAP-type C4-dicarboxylate transport system permease small subunit
MTHISAILKNSENYKRFVKVRSRLAAIAFLILLISLSFHSSTADHLSARASFIDLTIIGLLIGVFVFGLGTTIAAFILIPSKYRQYHPSSLKSFSDEEPSLAIHREDAEPSYPRNDWYNDGTNPISPIYQIIHNSQRD